MTGSFVISEISQSVPHVVACVRILTSFIRLNDISLYVLVTFDLSVHWSTDTGVASTSWLLWIMLPQTQGTNTCWSLCFHFREILIANPLRTSSLTLYSVPLEWGDFSVLKLVLDIWNAFSCISKSQWKCATQPSVVQSKTHELLLISCESSLNRSPSPTLKEKTKLTSI